MPAALGKTVLGPPHVTGLEACPGVSHAQSMWLKSPPPLPGSLLLRLIFDFECEVLSNCQLSFMSDYCHLSVARYPDNPPNLKGPTLPWKTRLSTSHGLQDKAHRAPRSALPSARGGGQAGVAGRAGSQHTGLRGRCRHEEISRSLPASNCRGRPA